MHTCICSTFLNNAHKESTTVGVVFVPISFEGYNIFDGSSGVAIQVSLTQEELYLYVAKSIYSSTCFYLPVNE